MFSKFKKLVGKKKDKKIMKVSKFMNENPTYDKYKIGIGSYGFPTINDWNDGTNLFIGNYCSFADNITILLGGEHHTDWITTYPFKTLGNPDFNLNCDRKSKGDVVIKNDVWISKNVIILSGVVIGNGAVIGAGSVVTKNVPSYSIVAGNPAKIIKYRFNSEEIASLKKIAWWDWPSEKIEKNRNSLLSNQIDEFIIQNLNE